MAFGRFDDNPYAARRPRWGEQPPDFFNAPTISDYMNKAALQSATAELQKMTDRSLQEWDAEPLADHLFQKYSLQPVEAHLDRADVEPQKVTHESRGRSGNIIYEHEHAAIVTVPCKPNPNLRAILLELAPSQTSTGSSDALEIQGSSLRVRIPLLEVNEGTVANAVQAAKNRVTNWLSVRNADITQCQPALKSNILSCVGHLMKSRQSVSSAFEKGAAAAGVPLRTKEAARPVDVSVKHPIQAVRQRQRKKDGPSLREEDVRTILDTLDRLGRQFEVAPETYTQVGEEGLRHILLGTLNAVFQLQGTAEAFSKTGKTDMYLVLNYDDGGALVAECKMWGGAESFKKALDQVYGYLTWRHSYAILIFFSKLKSPTQAVKEAQEALRQSPTFRSQEQISNESRLLTRHQHPDDPARQVEVHTLVFNLHVPPKTTK